MTVSSVFIATPARLTEGSVGYFQKAADSVFRQDHEEFVWMVVDDGSPVAVEDAMPEKYIRDSRLVIYRREKPENEILTASIATNEGIRQFFEDFRFTDIPYLTTLHTDDRLAPDSLKVRIDALDKNPDADGAIPNLER
ncbi:MAG: glycosyltransferase family 2 protein [Candidatus Micrarchaeota archaeon]|nr:glycosyltransferase family 2 protein [Candidatus Micrarchaeota archaeon]